MYSTLHVFLVRSFPGSAVLTFEKISDVYISASTSLSKESPVTLSGCVRSCMSKVSDWGGRISVLKRAPNENVSPHCTYFFRTRHSIASELVYDSTA